MRIHYPKLRNTDDDPCSVLSVSIAFKGTNFSILLSVIGTAGVKTESGVRPLKDIT